MIVLEHVVKRYRSARGNGKDDNARLVLNDINLTIPRDAKLALIGGNGAGKSTLLNLIGGMDMPTRGTVTRHCRVSWPLGLSGGFQGSLSGAQNVRFIARIHGVAEAHLAEKIDFVRTFSELGAALDLPVRTYSSGMRSRLAFAASLGFDFETYLVDELTAVGDADFRKKSRRAFSALASKAGLVMVSHDERTLRDFCDSALWLHEGKAQYFDRLADGLARYTAQRS